MSTASSNASIHALLKHCPPEERAQILHRLTAQPPTSAALRKAVESLPPEEQATALRLVTTRILTDDLLSYVTEAWRLIEPVTPLVTGRYLECLCEYLTAVSYGQIRRLIINIMPRIGKSSIISTLWPSWEWANDRATSRWIFCSHSNDLAVRDSVRRRNVMTSSWYQYYWPEVQFASDMNLKSEYVSTHAGSMFSTFVGGALGRGGSRLVIDDPHDAEGMFSSAERERTIAFVRSSLFSRLDHPATDAIVICHSRMHEEDLSGVLLHPELEPSSSIERLDLSDVPKSAPVSNYSGYTSALRVPGAPLLPPCFREPWE